MTIRSRANVGRPPRAAPDPLARPIGRYTHVFIFRCGRMAMGSSLTVAALLLAAPAWGKDEGCASAKCHTGIEPMHMSPAAHLGCTDCHGGRGDSTDKKQAHVAPRYPRLWPSTANPVRGYTLLNRESPEYVRFVNPGDLRAAEQSCGASGCHGDIVYKVKHSLMTHGSFLLGAVLYNNGGYPLKNAAFGESYDSRGVAQRLLDRKSVV